MTARTAPIVLAFKLGPKLFVLASKLAKSAKVAKLGLAGASVASYTWLFTWEFALVIVLSLVIHEYGHVRAMKAVGIPTKGFYLIPFVGGAAVPERAFHSRMEEQFVAIAGPVAGLVQAIVFYLLYLATDHPLAAAIASWVSILNLINLLPIMPLDGGRIMKSIAFSINSTLGTVFLLSGIGICLVAMALLNVWFLGFILLLASFDLYLERRGNCFAFQPNMTGDQSASCFVTYVLTCIGFVVIMLGCSAVPEAQLALDILRDG